MSKWIAEFELEDGDTMPEHMDLNYMGAKIDFYCRPLEQEPKTDYKSFCEFVAKTVMEEDFEINAEANAEIFCRKLADLGIVKADGDMWILESKDK